MNSEKFYIQLLRNAITAYSSNLPEYLQSTLATYLKSIDSIAKFHADTFYPKLLECDMETTKICHLIKTHINSLDFNVYFDYAAYVNEAISLIGNELNCVRIQFRRNLIIT